MWRPKSIFISTGSDREVPAVITKEKRFASYKKIFSEDGDPGCVKLGFSEATIRPDDTSRLSLIVVEKQIGRRV